MSRALSKTDLVFNSSKSFQQAPMGFRFPVSHCGAGSRGVGGSQNYGGGCQFCGGGCLWWVCGAWVWVIFWVGGYPCVSSWCFTVKTGHFWRFWGGLFMDSGYFPDLGCFWASGILEILLEIGFLPLQFLRLQIPVGDPCFH